MVSVIIPTYNREKTILKSINSVLKQTYKDIEVIIVDDCSTDNTEEIIKNIDDKRIIYYKLKENSGACVARNKGIDLAKGEFIAFQDSDDEWNKNKLEIQMKHLKNSKYDMNFCALNRIEKRKKKVIIPKGIINVDSDFTEQILNENKVSTQTILAKKYIFEKIRFDDRLPRFQDWDLVIEISKKYKIGFVNIPLVNLYIQEDSITKNPQKAVTAIKIIYEKNKEKIENNKEIKYNFDKKYVKFLFESGQPCSKEIKRVLKYKFDLKTFVYYISLITGTRKMLLNQR